MRVNLLRTVGPFIVKGSTGQPFNLTMLWLLWITMNPCHETAAHRGNIQRPGLLTFSVCFGVLDPYLVQSGNSFILFFYWDGFFALARVYSECLKRDVVIAPAGLTVHEASLWLMDILINDESITIDCQQPACFHGLKLVIASTTDRFNHVWQTPLILWCV